MSSNLLAAHTSTPYLVTRHPQYNRGLDDPGQKDPPLMPPTATQIHHRNDLNRQARTFLQDLLTPGPQTYQVIHEQAVARGIGKASLLTAKRMLGIRSTTATNGKALWQLPAA
jgi:hypothetical protein